MMAARRRVATRDMAPRGLPMPLWGAAKFGTAGLGGLTAHFSTWSMMRKIGAVVFYALSAAAALALTVNVLATAGAPLDLAPPMAWTLYGVEMLWLIVAGWRWRRCFLPE